MNEQLEARRPVYITHQSGLGVMELEMDLGDVGVLWFLSGSLLICVALRPQSYSSHKANTVSQNFVTAQRQRQKGKNVFARVRLRAHLCLLYIKSLKTTGQSLIKHSALAKTKRAVSLLVLQIF